MLNQSGLVLRSNVSAGGIMLPRIYYVTCLDSPLYAEVVNYSYILSYYQVGPVIQRWTQPGAGFCVKVRTSCP